MKKLLLGLLMVAGGANMWGMESPDEDPVFVEWKSKISFDKTTFKIELCHIKDYLEGNTKGLTQYIAAFDQMARNSKSKATKEFAETKFNQLSKLKEAIDDWQRSTTGNGYITRLVTAIKARITAENWPACSVPKK